MPNHVTPEIQHAILTLLTDEAALIGEGEINSVSIYPQKTTDGKIHMVLAIRDEEIAADVFRFFQDYTHVAMIIKSNIANNNESIMGEEN
jgi:hypothetical protein